MISVYLYSGKSELLHQLYNAILGYQLISNWEFKIEYASTSEVTFISYLAVHPSSNGIYFLDIDNSPLSCGLEIARQVRTSDPLASIILLSSSPKSIMESFRLKLAVLDYIITDGSSLNGPVQQCLEYLEKKYLNTSAKESFFFSFRTKGNYHTVLTSEIYYIESIKQTHKLCLHMQSSTYYLADSLSSVYRRLESNFFQCHRSCLVNTLHIKELQTVNYRILLDNNESCPCSVRNWKQLVQACQNACRPG